SSVMWVMRLRFPTSSCPTVTANHLAGAVLVLGLLVLGAAGCARHGPRESRQAPSSCLPVVATIYPLADWARQIGGEHVDVAPLLKPGSNPHTYEPSPQDSLLIARCKLLFSVGLGLEDWVDDLAIAAAPEGPRVVRLGETLPREKLLAGDPHVWLDPDLAAAMVEKMAAAMGETAPAHAAEYAGRASQYAARMRALAEKCARRLAGLPVRKAVVHHPAFGYLFRRCGIELVGAIEESPGKEPTSAHLASLADKMKRNGIKVIFVEPQTSRKPAEVLAREIGARVVMLDDLGDPTDPKRATYVSLIEYNVEQIAAAMGGLAGRREGDQ
ncbi:MAG: metal ABC transporter substrate-binding protein, partial [Armatimonadetes bacterium]|nr:metal ABC transporter substrate-binding protein [Armatimonadota bacterium]